MGDSKFRQMKYANSTRQNFKLVLPFVFLPTSFAVTSVDKPVKHFVNALMSRAP